jgi:hypothetical protein
MNCEFKLVLNENGDPDRTFKPGDIVRHFKGGFYIILVIAINTETKEKEMIYQSLNLEKNGDKNIWARPYDMFIGEVDTVKYPDVNQKYRLEKVYFK